jgi:hypothetical protein
VDVVNAAKLLRRPEVYLASNRAEFQADDFRRRRSSSTAKWGFTAAR